MGSSLYNLGKWAVRRRRLVVAVWIVIVIAAVASGRTWGGEFVDDFRLPGSESEQARELLEEEFPSQAGGSARIVFSAPEGLQEPAAQEAMESTLDAIVALPHVSFVGDPLSGRGGALSSTGTIAFADVRYDQPLAQLGSQAVQRLEDAAEVGRTQGVQVELGGELLGFAREPQTRGAEVVGLLAAGLILVVGFGSVIAAGLPLALALGGLATGLSLVGLGAAVFDMSSVGLMLGTMIGLGVGIDYALFIVTRHRRFLHDGLEVAEAAGRATATAGRAVLFAGITVIIAITGLTVAGIPAITLMGFSAALVVAVMVVGSVTLVPALLGVAGRRIDWLSLRKSAPSDGEAGSVWGRWGRKVESRPWVSLVVGLALLLGLALPALSLDLAMPDGGLEAEDSSRRQAYDLLEEGFGPGFNGPLLLVLDLPAEPGGEVQGNEGATTATTSPTVAAATPTAEGSQELLTALRERLSQTANVAQVSPPMVSPDGAAAVLQLTPATGPQSEETEALVHELRGELLPQALEGTGTQAHVAGQSAMLIDFTERTVERLPWFMLTVIGLSFLLLTMVFRSVVIPATAAVMNILSIAAAYGVVVAVFQWGWGAELIGVEQTTPIITFLPMLMFAILFGLSMDYEVFLLSRIQEEHDAGHSNADSVVRGLAATGRVITSAAAIMVVVFTGFVFGDDVAVKQIGLGLAVAILVDATLVRVLLVPSTMVLIGEANWWTPRWLERITPGFDVGEGDADTHSADLHSDHVPGETGEAGKTAGAAAGAHHSAVYRPRPEGTLKESES